jgi:hypothetical protein
VSQRLSLPTVTRDFTGEERIIRGLLKKQTDTRLIIDYMSGAPLLRKVTQGVILSGHDCLSRLYREEGRYATSWRGRWHFRIRRFFALNSERQFAHLADRMHLVSQVDADEMKAINPRVKPFVIPIGCSTPPADKLKPFSSRSERLLWGNLELPVIREGFRTLFDEVIRKKSSALENFLLLGRVPEADARHILPELDALGIRYQSKVDDLGALLGNTKLVVLSDLSGAGQKNRTMDALAHRCCAIGLNEAFRGIINDTGNRAFIESNNVGELLSHLETLDLDSAATIASAGQVLVQKHFSPPVLRCRWLELLASIPPLRLANQ